MKTKRFGIGQVFSCYMLVVFVSILFCGSASALPPPNLAIESSLMTFLSFSNLTIGESYQMQRSVAWYWTNLPVSFTATNTVYTQMVAGAVRSVDYRLALNPVPVQAFAVAQVVNGFVVGAIIADGGSGYVTAASVSIVRGGGTNATAIASISSSGVVTNITITGNGTGYTTAPVVKIGQPPVVAVSPWTQPVLRLTAPSFFIGGWRLQFTPELGAAWQNYGIVTNTQTDLFITNNRGFFRLIYP